MSKNRNIFAALATVAAGAAIINSTKRADGTPIQSAAKEALTVPTIADASIFDGNIDPNFAQNLPAKVGDYYLDTQATTMYKLVVSGQKSVWIPIIEFSKSVVTQTGGAIGAQGPQGPQGPQGANGANGTPGPKILNGTGDPSNGLTAGTIIGDYYLDGVTGNLWQREAATMDFTPTIVDLPGGVRWRRVAVLKGPAGANGTNGLQRLDESTVIELNQDIKSEFDNIARIKFLSNAMKVYRGLSVEPSSYTGSVTLDLTDFDTIVKNAFGIFGEIDSDNAVINFRVRSYNAQGLAFMDLQRFNGERRTTTFLGSGLVIPVLTSAQISTVDSIQPIDNGTILYNSTTSNIQLRTAAGWVNLMKDGARLVLGGTDNLTDRLQVTGTSKFSSFIDISANGLKMQGQQTLLYSGGNLYQYANNGGHIFLNTPGGSILFEIKSNGRLFLMNTITAAGTTGAQTINRPSGTVNMAAGQNTLVVTNDTISVNSLVFCTIRTNDSTALIKNVVPASGSFTIRLNANATAETSIGFFAIN